MKKLIAIACVVVAISAAADVSAAGWRAGVKGGVNMADLTGDDAPENSSTRNGFAGGLFAETHISGRFGFRPEVLYIQKGAEGDFVVPGDDHPHESIIKLDYVEVPLLFTVNFAPGEKLSFNLFVGPTVGFNNTAEVEIPGHGETVELDVVEDFEFGATVGAGAEYMLSSFSLLLDVRYGFGFTSVIQDIEGEAVDVMNNGIGILAGVGFGL